MTVCICDDWHMADSRDLLDYHKTVDRLREAMKILENATILAKKSKEAV